MPICFLLCFLLQKCVAHCCVLHFSWFLVVSRLVQNECKVPAEGTLLFSSVDPNIKVIFPPGVTKEPRSVKLQVCMLFGELWCSCFLMFSAEPNRDVSKSSISLLGAGGTEWAVWEFGAWLLCSPCCLPHPGAASLCRRDTGNHSQCWVQSQSPALPLPGLRRGFSQASENSAASSTRGHRSAYSQNWQREMPYLENHK